MNTGNATLDVRANEPTLKEDSIENDAKEEIRRDVFTTEEEATDRAKELGCDGIHKHDENGNTIYMPCKTHEEYVLATGTDVKSQHIEFKSEIKAYQDEEDEEKGEYGRFEGYASVFENTDLGNDVIKTGAFKKSIRRRGNKGVKLLYQHKSDMPIGVFDSIKEDDHGLYVKGRLALQTQAGGEAYELLKMGALDGMSIGFRADPKTITYDKRSKKRMIGEVDLMEISLVTFPMNPKATVMSVKGEAVSIREWENGMRDAFNLSRSEAKMAAKAVHHAFESKSSSEMLQEKEEKEQKELVDAIKTLTLTLKTSN